MPRPTTLFPVDFLVALRVLINVHHSIYLRIPPYGLLFEMLVQEAFRWARKPFTPIETTGRTEPTYDLLVEGVRISLKTETGKGTTRDWIHITKLCTTERPPWTPTALKHRVLTHLSNYDVILMLRAIWEDDIIHYQLVEIPVDLLRLIRDVELQPVGKGKSLAADVRRSETRIFRVYLDATDRKCQIQKLDVGQCIVLMEWDLHLGGATRIF